jgi:RHS repeat-associated protein
LPFGEDAGVVGENEKHRFTTYERDSESGTDYAVNRQHSFNTGRFMQPDPILGDIDIPQSLNRYAYAQNEPVDLTDPLGLQVYCFGYFLTIIYVQDGKIIGREPTQFFPVFCVDIGGPEEGASKGVAAALSSEAKQALDPCAKKRAEARKQVDELLAKTGLDKFIKEKRVSESGKGYILEFKDIQAARKFVESSALFTGGGSFGGLLHINELKRNGDKGPFSDFRSFTGSSGTGKRSLQVTFGGRLAFVDSDKFNYRQDAFGFFGHTFGEVLPGLFKKLFGKKDC